MSDLISRQAAIDEANAWLLDCFKAQKQDRSCGLIRRLEDLPSADRKGHWIKHGEPPWYVIECSECGAKWQMSGSWDANNFCGNCGAKMDEEVDNG